MRTKKVILLVGNDEQGLSVLSFMFATNSFRVLSATNPPEAVTLFRRSSIDLVIADFKMMTMDGVELAGILKQIDSLVPIILLGDPAKMSDTVSPADALLDKKTSAADLLGWAKFKTTRKRGPRKASQRRQPPVLSHAATQSV